MNGMKRSGKPGIVQPMQMPPTFGQPPTPADPAPDRDVALDHRALAAELDQAAPGIGRASGQTRPARRSRPARSPPARCGRTATSGRPCSSSSIIGSTPATCSARCSSVSVMLSGWTGQPGRLTIGTPRRDTQPGAQVVAQSHRTGGIAAHRRDPAVGGARAERQHGGRARRQPVDPGAGGDRLTGLGVDPERRPVALAVDAPRWAPTPRARARTGRALPRPRPERAHEVLAALVGEQRVVDGQPRHPGQHAVQQVLEAGAGGARHGHRVAVAAEARGQPHARARAGAPSCAYPGPNSMPCISRPPGARRRPGRAARRGRRRARSSCRAGSWMLPCRCHSSPWPVTSPARASRDEGVRHRRALGADQPTQQLMGERQRQADAARLDPAPARGQMPEQQRQAHVETRLAGDRPLHVEVAGPALGPAQQRLHDLRPRPDALGERGVEDREAHRHQRPPADRAGQQLLVGSARTARCRSPGPSSSAAIRSPTRTLTAITPSSTSTPGPGVAAASRSRQLDLARVDLERHRGGRRARATMRIRTSSASARSRSRSSRY